MEDRHIPANDISPPAWNGKRELSAAAVVLACCNARRMTRRGYTLSLWGDFDGEAGDVTSPDGTIYQVWLPGVLSSYPEGKCSCPYFAQEHICKHLYFAVETARCEPLPTGSLEACEEWDSLVEDDTKESKKAVRSLIEQSIEAPLPLSRPLPKPIY